MTFKLYSIVKCTNEGIDSVQSFAKADIAKEVFNDLVESEVELSKKGNYYDSHTRKNTRAKIFYVEGDWLEIEIVENEVFVEV